MCGLDHVGSMDVVVVGYVCVVVIFQGHHKGDEGVGGDLEGLQQLTLLEERDDVETLAAWSLLEFFQEGLNSRRRLKGEVSAEC